MKKIQHWKNTKEEYSRLNKLCSKTLLALALTRLVIFGFAYNRQIFWEKYTHSE